MPGYFRATAIVMTAGAIAGSVVLAILPPAPIDPRDDSRPPLFTILEGTGRPQVPCRQQLWVNSDRDCQTWTIPHPNVKGMLLEKTDAIETGVATENRGALAEIADMPMSAPKSETTPAPPVEAENQVMLQIAAQPHESASDRAAEPMAAAYAHSVGGETLAEVRARASRVRDDKSKIASRGPDGPRNIPVASRSADGTRRVIMIRPTSRQDVLYYSALRVPQSTAASR
jgi:hypothetical protein